jgi:6-carboxyhexanoate--CoA ligase
MEEQLYSLRMRASRDGSHLSGAERLAPSADLDSLAAAMVRRALEHPRGRADTIHLSIETVAPGRVRLAQLADLRTFAVADFHQGRRAARELLSEAGIAPESVSLAMNAIAGGAAPDGRSMRGAMLIDARTGQRLEPDHFRGIRVSRMDLTREAEQLLRQGLRNLGLDNQHVREALVLAGKVSLAPEVLAELCWSDDPDYTAGYVATAQGGYVRFPHLKPAGEERGGRAFFVAADRIDVASLVTFLEQEAVLFDRIGKLQAERRWEG